MALSIVHHAGAPKFMPALGIGRPALDMSLVAKIPGGSPLHGAVSFIQRSADTLGIRAHALPMEQSHITLVNAACRETPPIPCQDKQTALFRQLCEAVSTDPVRSWLEMPATMTFDRILVNKWDVKIAAESSNWQQRRSDIAAHLAGLDPEYFLPAENTPLFYSTVLRFADGFNEDDYEKIMAVLEQAARSSPFDLSVSLDTISAVKFPGKYLQWETSRNIGLLADYETKHRAFMDVGKRAGENGEEFIIDASGIAKNRCFYETDKNGMLTDMPKECDIYPIIICIPEDSKVGEFLRKTTEETKAKIPAATACAVQKEGTMHISVFTPENGKDKSLYADVIAEFKPYSLKLSGIRFMPDGVVIGVFEDEGATSALRNMARETFGAPAVSRGIIHTTLFRFLDDIDEATLAKLKTMAANLKDLSDKNLEFPVSRLYCVHETRYLQYEQEVFL
jgi:hypothetical protein